jgi:hypothetical protein
MVLGLLKEGMRLDEIVKLQWYDPRLATHPQLAALKRVDTKRVDSVDSVDTRPVDRRAYKRQHEAARRQRLKAAKAKERDV